MYVLVIAVTKYTLSIAQDNFSLFIFADYFCGSDFLWYDFRNVEWCCARLCYYIIFTVWNWKNLLLLIE